MPTTRATLQKLTLGRAGACMLAYMRKPVRTQLAHRMQKDDLGARDMIMRSELQQQALPPGKQAAPFHLVIPRVFVPLDFGFAARCNPGPQSCPTLAAGSCVKLASNSGSFPARTANREALGCALSL